MFVPPREDSEKLSGFHLGKLRPSILRTNTDAARESSEKSSKISAERKALEERQRKRNAIPIRKLKPREIHENKWFINTFNANLLACLLEWKIEFIA